jgi:stringent starvation protein B
MMSVPLPPKKEVALALLERSSVHVHLDPRSSGVVVPAWFKKQPQLVLQVGLNMPVPIPDLRLDEEGMSCTLSFNRTPFFCVVPWPSVYAMVGDDGRGMVWPDDVPPEVASQARGRENEAAAPKRAPAKRADGQGATPAAGPDARARDGAAARKGGGPDGARPQIAAVPTPSKAKKPRKRARSDGPNGAEPDTRTRGGLVAVPSASHKKSHDHPPPAPTKAPSADSAPNTRAIQAERRPNTPPRPKRELPPYLRVVK